jgi:hypothetical protein
VKKSCGDEACEEVIIPSGDFALGAHAVFCGSFSHQIVSHVLERGEVCVSVIGADAAFTAQWQRMTGPRACASNIRRET